MNEPPHSRLCLAHIEQQKMKALAVYEKNNERFEDITMLFTEEYLQNMKNELFAYVSSARKGKSILRKKSPELSDNVSTIKRYTGQ